MKRRGRLGGRCGGINIQCEGVQNAPFHKGSIDCTLCTHYVFFTCKIDGQFLDLTTVFWSMFINSE